MRRSFAEVIHLRFGTTLDGPDTLTSYANHRSCRNFAERAVPENLVEALAATALSAPTKSDLQQADIVWIQDPDMRATIGAWFPNDPWIAAAPVLLVFCGNNLRQRQIAEWRGHRFANDHLDAFFNATVDTAIVLASFLIAAEQVGLGGCPISEVRDRAQELSALLRLPDYVFPVAGLALGWPLSEDPLSPRLPLSVTFHQDHHRPFTREQMAAYDARRNQTKPFVEQRNPKRFGVHPGYGWSEDKARQYAEPLRQGFGKFIRDKGFKLVH